MPKKKVPTNPVTPEAREAFLLYLQEWRERLGLHDWRVVLSEKPSTAAGDVRCNLEARLATIRLGTDFHNEPVNDETIEDTAVHELLHVLLFEFKTFAQNPASNEADVRSAEHRVIHALLNLLVHQR